MNFNGFNEFARIAIEMRDVQRDVHKEGSLRLISSHSQVNLQILTDTVVVRVTAPFLRNAFA